MQALGVEQQSILVPVSPELSNPSMRGSMVAAPVAVVEPAHESSRAPVAEGILMPEGRMSTAMRTKLALQRGKQQIQVMRKPGLFRDELCTTVEVEHELPPAAIAACMDAACKKDDFVPSEPPIATPVRNNRRVVGSDAELTDERMAEICEHTDDEEASLDTIHFEEEDMPDALVMDDDAPESVSLEIPEMSADEADGEQSDAEVVAGQAVEAAKVKQSDAAMIAGPAVEATKVKQMSDAAMVAGPAVEATKVAEEEQSKGRQQVDALLGCPDNWGQPADEFLSKEEQQPSKPRGRRPMKKPSACKAPRHPVADDEAGDSSDGDCVSNEDEVVTKKRKARKAAGSVKGKRGRSSSVKPEKGKGSKRKVSEQKPRHKKPVSKPKSKASKAPKAKAKSKAKAGKSGKAAKRPACLDTAEYKARQSRKSSAYHQAMKMARNSGLSVEDCKAKAREAAW